MGTSRDEFTDALASFVGGVIGFAIFVWVAWCVVIGFAGGTYPLTDQYTDGSIGSGIAAMFVASAIGAIAGTILAWVAGAVVALIAGVSWVGGKVLDGKRPFSEWSDEELHSCIQSTMSSSVSVSTGDTVIFVFHQDPGKLPRNVVRNTTRRFGEFAPYVTFEVNVVEPEFGTTHIPWRDARVGWSSHTTLDEAVDAGKQKVGSEAHEIPGDDPRLDRFHATLYSAVRGPWDWD